MAAAKQPLALRLKEAIAQAPAPSLVPDFNPPPPKEEEVIPSVRDLIADKKELLTLRRMMTRHIELGKIQSAAKKERDKLTNAIKSIAGKYKIGKAEYDGDKINYFSGSRSTIKGDLLLGAGIQPSVIAACTETTITYTLKITGANDEEE